MELLDNFVATEKIFFHLQRKFCSTNYDCSYISANFHSTGSVRPAFNPLPMIAEIHMQMPSSRFEIENHARKIDFIPKVWKIYCTNHKYIQGDPWLNGQTAGAEKPQTPSLK